MDSQKTKKKLTGSVLALIVCFAMLLGTTFAWFTDVASTNVNTIQAGKLDVALEMRAANDDWVSAEGTTLNFVDKDSNNLWEPGCTYNLPELHIVNKGNLALKYKIQITGIDGDEKLNEVIDWTINGATLDQEYSLGTDKTSDSLTISARMKESAGNAYQGLSIEGVAITVLATQDTVEYDSDNNQYDKEAKYSTANAKTTKMLISGGSKTINRVLSINSDMTGGNSDVIRVTGGNHEIDGGKYEAFGNKSNSALRVDNGTVTITDGEFIVNGSSNAIYAAGGTIIIKGGSFTSTEAYNGTYFTLNCQDGCGSVITVKGGSFYNFDPSNANTGKGEIVVADGYKVVHEGEWYKVVENK